MNRIESIKPADRAAMKRAEKKWNSVAKPLHSLGIGEEDVIKLAGIFGTENFSLDKRCAVIMCADNGVVCEGVTQTDSSVTGIVAKAIAEGTSNINTMARVYNADVFAVDIGICGNVDSERLIRRRVDNGTKNIAVGAAMTREQCRQAVSVGMDCVKECIENGYKIIITGEMGIGNTTTAAAVASVLLGVEPEAVTGRGAGLDEEGLARKISAVKRAIEVNRPDRNDAWDILSKVGGYDIAGMVGLFLGGAAYHIPAVIDGVISAAAAVLAVMICPDAADYMLASHVSAEPAGRMLLDRLGLKPIITGEMRLGEGTGGIMLLPILDGVMSVYDSAHRFADLPMEEYTEQC